MFLLPDHLSPFLILFAHSKIAAPPISLLSCSLPLGSSSSPQATPQLVLPQGQQLVWLLLIWSWISSPVGRTPLRSSLGVRMVARFSSPSAQARALSLFPLEAARDMVLILHSDNILRRSTCRLNKNGGSTTLLHQNHRVNEDSGGPRDRALLWRWTTINIMAVLPLVIGQGSTLLGRLRP
ncbi:uncharacterized protein [Triticum aestivum]|uniref:uncharacterized protein isoform X1 n=1 Tax=Triticum aestivum TaxID=4565 RepID=UPI001D02658C|nr:uncharacterized protein LOC123081939 isoform X1 [Triticum aestivum]